jgi:hypothetical protein
MSKIITKELFANSYYSIGAGLTLSPMLKMSHLTSDFIFCNLYLTKNEVKRWYDRNIEYSNDLSLVEFKEVDDFDELHHFELPYNYTQYLYKPGYISIAEFNGYMSSFQDAKHKSQFCLIYKVFRHSIQKELTLYYITTEGFATLNLMSENGKARMPQIVDCIQCGNIIDNGENGLLARFFSQSKVKLPLLWIRGHQPNYSKWENTRSKSLVKAGPMPVVGLDFGTSWTAGNFNPGFRHDPKRYVKGFITEELCKKLTEPGLAKKISTSKDQISFDSILSHIPFIPKDEVIVINRYLAKKHHIEGNNVVIWESIKFSHYNNMVFSPASVIVQRLSDYLEKKEFSAKVHLIPYTTEDQGAAFIQCLSMLKNPTISYLYRPFDIVDLKLQQINN